MQLTESDYNALERCFIPRQIADAAGIYRVDSLEGRDHVGRNGPGDFSGLLFPYRWPGSTDVLIERLRLDHPPIDSAGKTSYKYLSAPGARNHIYCPLADPRWLDDESLPVIVTEGEKKYLALAYAATLHQQNGQPRWLALALAGVWSFRGQTGIRTDSAGHRVPEKGIIPDFDKLRWKGRKVFILYDANTATNPAVSAARRELARELERRGAVVYLVDLPPAAGINGVDDYLAANGLDALLKLLASAFRYDWHDELARSDKGKILANFSNALIALRLAPEWRGVLAYNEFALEPGMRRPPPWGGPAGPWSDYQDSRLIEWLETQGIRISDTHATRAAITVARENPYHPVREYLTGLKWDGVARIDDWLTMYLGVEPSDYVRAVGAKWLISGAARAFDPGCKADHALIFEGMQGKGKSTALEILGGEFYSDDIAELGTKDAALGTAGAWIIELSELDAMRRVEVSRTNSFVSRRVDRFRPPYGRHYVRMPRGCIFGGSVNQAHYLKDDSGGRRFWPVKCGERLNLEWLRRDRDQLWAEATVRYRQHEPWWLDTEELVAAALDEQEDRYEAHPWEAVIAAWLIGQTEVTTAEVLALAIGKDRGQWTRRDEIDVGGVLRRLGWVVASRPRIGGKRQRVYREKTEIEEAAIVGRRR
jgi:predicted P-loop ATPase